MTEKPGVTIRYLDPVEQGASLSEKAVDVHVVNGQEFVARWFHSPLDSDLMIWFDEQGAAARFQLNSGGQIVDWNSVEGLQTGLIVELEIAAVSAKKNADVAETIRFDHQVNLDAVRNARLIFEACPNLQLAVREHLARHLDDIRPASRSARVNASRTRFWGRFKRWTIGA